MSLGWNIGSSCIRRTWVFAAAMMLVAGQPVTTLADDRARSIAQKMYDRDDGKDSWAVVQMTLIESGGRQQVRKLINATKDYGELTRRYIRFTEPRAIEGTSFLALERHEDSDVQFLYLPSLRRVRRVAAGQKDRSFVNTDFTYEDMERRKVERDEYTLVGSKTVLGKDCWVLERRPMDGSDSQYDRVRMWVAKDSYLTVKADMYSKAGKHAKTFEVQEIKKIDGIATAMASSMRDLEEEHETVTRIIDIKYNSGVKDEVFTEAYLEKSG